jgi:hypothetical protein
MLESGNDWNTYITFDYDVLKAAGMNEDLIRAVMNGGKESIPYEFRELCCSLQKEKVIEDYVEENSYYRMLNGEPPLTDTK